MTSSVSDSTWIMDMLRYFKPNDTALPSMAPSLSGKDVHLVNAVVKRSMDKSGTEKTRSGSITTIPQKNERR